MPDRTQQPPTHSFGKVRLQFPTPTLLPNGIPLYCIGDGEEEVVRVEVHMFGGYYQSPANKFLLPYLTALTALDGCQGLEPDEVSEKWDYFGAMKQAVCSNQHSVLVLSSLCSNLKDTLPLFGNCVMHPTFPEKEFTIAKHRLAGNLATQRQRVSYLASQQSSALYYGDNHPLGRSVRYLTEENILAIKRHDLLKFHHRHYYPANCRIVISGHVGEQELQLLSDTFGQWSDPRPAMPTQSYTPLGARNGLSQIDKPGAMQAAVNMRLNAIARNHPHYFKLRMAVTALGGYFGSRLNTHLREEKGYTYGITAGLIGQNDEAHISIGTECDNRYVGAVIDGVKRDMELMKREPMSQQELDTVKQYMLSDLAKVLDTPFSIASHVSNTWLYGTYPEYFNEQVASILTATALDVQEMAQRYFDTDGILTVIAGDTKEIDVNKS